MDELPPSMFDQFEDAERSAFGTQYRKLADGSVEYTLAGPEHE